MTSFSALPLVSRALQARIRAALDAGFAQDPGTVALAPPAADLDPSVAAVLHLYHIGLDPHLRNQPRPLAPIPLTLRYLFVPLIPDEECNQGMLGAVLQDLHDRPGDLLEVAGARGDPPAAFRLRPEFLGVEELARLWSALSRPCRLAAGLVVEGPLPPAEAP